MKWGFIYYSERVQKKILSLPKELLAEYYALQERMENDGPAIGMPYTRAMGDGLFEMRLKGADGIARVFYGAVQRDMIIIINAFVKKTQKTPDKELRLARKRLKEVQNHG